MLTDKSGTLRDRIVEDKAQELANEIDREVLWSMLENLGWVRVMIKQRDDWAISVWLEEHCKGAYEHHRTDFIFENEKDANWFKIRWL